MPAIVRPGILMPVKKFIIEPGHPSFITYRSIGNREDLSDLIYNIMPTETPFLGAFTVSDDWDAYD